MDTVKGFLGIKTAAQKKAEADARTAQVQQGRDQEQSAVALAQTQSAADRIARAAGQRILAFGGNEAGTGAGAGAATLGG